MILVCIVSSHCHVLKSLEGSISVFKGESLLSSCHSCSIVPIYGYNPHLGNYFLCVSPLTDLNEKQLMRKACNLNMTSLFSITFSAVQCCDCLFSTSLTIKDTRPRRVTLDSLYHCECVHRVHASVVS